VAGDSPDDCRPALNGRRSGLAAFEFDSGTLTLTEAGPSTAPRSTSSTAAGNRRTGASESIRRAFRSAEIREPTLNAPSRPAFSAASATPTPTRSCIAPAESRRHDAEVVAEETARLHAAAGEVLGEWVDRLRAQRKEVPGEGDGVRPEMAAHGKYGQPVPAAAAGSSASGMPATNQLLSGVPDGGRLCGPGALGLLRQTGRALRRTGSPQAAVGGQTIAFCGLSSLIKGRLVDRRQKTIVCPTGVCLGERIGQALLEEPLRPSSTAFVVAAFCPASKCHPTAIA